MLANTFSPIATDVLLAVDKQIWSQSKTTGRRVKRPKFPPDADIEGWLTHNAPAAFQELADIRYVLYHRCGRAGFSVTNIADNEFVLFGRHSELRIINDRARHYLLWRLRLLGRAIGWIGALPQTKKPRNQ